MTAAPLDSVEAARHEMAPRVSRSHKSAFGQFMTPMATARFMAALFPAGGSEARLCRLLDAGAGLGSLSCAFLDRWTSRGFDFDRVEVRAFEIDTALHEGLEDALSAYGDRAGLDVDIVVDDFIKWAVDRMQFGQGRCFTHAILNPPYKKIAGNSAHRFLLRQVGLETVNLYSAFVAMALDLLVPGGQLVAIVPRSFCNGPYYRPFRQFLLRRAAIRHLHLFDSRNTAFRDDDVLQENVVVLLERDGVQKDVTVSTSTDDRFFDMESYRHSFDSIVFPGDAEQFIHVPVSLERSVVETSSVVCHTLEDLGVSVSTGPVVDFRVREHLHDMPGPGCVPLLYPGHFSGTCINWPKPGFKKPNAILRCSDTEKSLYPMGHYTVVRRFSSKEEKRRIVASTVVPEAFPALSMLGFENHLNVFHERRSGLCAALAHGLSTFLNSTAVDSYFRRFNGHTQVNATDLRNMRYPSRAALTELGLWAQEQSCISQSLIDGRLVELAA
jgi:predicted RNA methylase